MTGLKEKVIDNKLCSGCGACSVVNDAIKISFDETGQLIAAYTELNKVASEEKVCPFSDKSMNENSIQEKLFKNHKYAKYVGYYLNCFIGHVEEGEFRKLGASGGFGRWLNYKLLENKAVDYVIHVAPSSSGIFEYQITNKTSELLNSARSAYYPVTMESALKFVLENEARFSITALPCFSKALRNLAEVEPKIQERIKFVIGIVCGHLKTKEFAESLALQVGVQPAELKNVDFRYKIEGKRANEKGFVAYRKDGTITEPVNTRELIGGDWGHGLFKYKACDYCDDVLAETADIAIGDAWLPEYMTDTKGKSILVVKNKYILDILQNSFSTKHIIIQEVTPDKIVKSQAGGIRHRNAGLEQRLFDDIRDGKFVPRKRVKPKKQLDPSVRYVTQFRVSSRENSHIIFKKSLKNGLYDLSLFRKEAMKLVANAKPPLWMRLISRLLKKF